MYEEITDDDFKKIIEPIRELIDRAYWECWQATRRVRYLEATVASLKDENARLRAQLEASEPDWWEQAPPFTGDGI